MLTKGRLLLSYTLPTILYMLLLSDYIDKLEFMINICSVIYFNIVCEFIKHYETLTFFFTNHMYIPHSDYCTTLPMYIKCSDYCNTLPTLSYFFLQFIMPPPPYKSLSHIYVCLIEQVFFRDICTKYNDGISLTIIEPGLWMCKNSLHNFSMLDIFQN